MDTIIQKNKIKSISIDKVVSSTEAKLLLNTDNSELKSLCKQAEIKPKKDTNSGKTFFLKEDVNFLKRIKELHSRGKRIFEEKMGNNALMAPIQEPTPTIPHSLQSEVQMQKLVDNIITAQESVIGRVQKVLEDKLDGMDEVVVELIRCKSENENLRNKLNNLTKENYKLRREVDSYRPVPFGFFVKDTVEDLRYLD